MRFIFQVLGGFLITSIFLFLYLLFIVFKEKLHEKTKFSKSLLYKDFIQKEMEQIRKKRKISAEHLTFLQKELVKVDNLAVFEEVLVSFQNTDAALVRSYCMQVAEVFQYLTRCYKEKPAIERAYFTHVLSLFPEIIQNDDRSIQYAMMHFVFDSSVYTRENAMLFFYHKGSVEQVVNSLKKINKRGLYYSPKLLADDLLQFAGDREKLADLLLDDFKEFSVSFQLSIVHYLRFSAVNRRDELYRKLITHQYHMEVELAIIRYFSSQTYSLAMDELIRIMNDSSYPVEYRIVTSFALGSYEKRAVKKVLMKFLTDENWYVRKNCAVSLSKMNLLADELRTLSNMKDSYAKEMIEYIWQGVESTMKLKNDRKEKKAV